MAVAILLGACATAPSTADNWPPPVEEVLLAVGLSAAATVLMGMAVEHNTKRQIRQICKKYEAHEGQFM